MMQSSNEKLNEEKVFKDPVHSYVHVQDRIIWDLIATKEFQRLRRIRQLGTTFFTFHGAEHSRFNHSLGVYEIVRRIVDDVFKERKEWKKDQRLIVLCAALLHDLGHGPFSHSFEKVFQLDHEQFTQAIILGDTEVNMILRCVSDDFPEKVASVINKTYEDQLVVSLISSQIDADRMDYLQRDSYFTGVSYGHFDMARLLRVVRPYKDTIVFKSSGMHAVEDYIMSRYQMYWQVYFHPVTRSAEVILIKILQRAKALYTGKYQFQYEPHHFTFLFNNETNLEEYIKLDESVVMYYFHMWEDEKDPILSDLCKRFMNRRLFKYVQYDEKYEETYDHLRELFKQVDIDPDYYLALDSSSDLPYDFYRPGDPDSRTPILLQMPNGDIREMSTESTVVEAITGKIRTDEKLYYPKDLLRDQTENGEVKREILRIIQQMG